jgi:two-component system nitrate/nitrite response regulator NarL
MTVVGEAHDGETALRVVERSRPDLLLLDLALQGISGLEVLGRLSTMKLPTRSVAVSAAIEATQLRTALMRGARGVLEKHVPGDLLVKCIRQVMKGEYWIGRDNVGDLVEALRKSAKGAEPGSPLSQRERDIVNAVLKGASNKDIAWQLGLGEQTVKNHLRRIFAKLGVANRVELAVHSMARQLGAEGDSERPM